MEKNKTLWFSDEVVDFIKSHNALSRASKKYNSSLTIYWNNCKYLETDNPNVFEVIFENDLLDEIVENRRKLKDEQRDNN